MAKKPIVYIDMDEVLTDFYNHPKYEIPRRSWNHPLIYKEGFFRDLPPLPGAVNAVSKILNSRKYDVYIASCPLHGSPHSYSEKVEWIMQHIPYLQNRIILIRDKWLLKGDYLIDDSIKYQKEFEGEFIHFSNATDSADMWDAILNKLGVK